MHPIYNYIIFCTCLGTLGQFKGLLLFSHFAVCTDALSCCSAGSWDCMQSVASRLGITKFSISSLFHH